MSELQARIIAILLIFAFASSPYCFGVQVGAVVITPCSASFALAALFTVYARLTSSLPVISSLLLSQPAFIATVIYFSIGISTGLIAEDKAAFIKEIIQRTTIIWLPLFGMSMGLRKIKYAKYALLGYLPGAGLLALLTAAAGISSKFDQPVYIMGLHKNMTASLCATMAIICGAHLLSSKRPFLQFPGENELIRKIRVPNRLFFGGLFGLAVLGILACQGRAGLIEVVVAAYVMLFAMRAKPRTLIAMTVSCVVGLGLIIKLMPEHAMEHVVSTQRHSANAVRLEIWTDIRPQLHGKPIYGFRMGKSIRR